jgi:hypothetical protein
MANGYTKQGQLHFALTDSTDLATFPTFGKFLEKLGELQPTVVLAYIDKLGSSLERFLPNMLLGLLVSHERGNALAKIDGWLLEGRYLDDITWFLRFADPFDESLLHRTLQSAIKHDSVQAVRNILLACADQYDKHLGSLVEKVFLPALYQLSAKQDFSWLSPQLVSWMNKPIIEALDEQQSGVVLNELLSYPKLEYNAEYLVASIAKKWPKLIIEFFGKRQVLERETQAPKGYNAVPFSMGHALQGSLAAVPDFMIAGAHQWFDKYPQCFQFCGGRLLSLAFPELDNGLSKCLDVLIAKNNESDFAFVLAILLAFEGKPIVYDHIRRIVAELDGNNPLVKKAEYVLQQGGVGRGEFGFVDRLEQRKCLLIPWLTDENKRVQAFAKSQIQQLEQSIAAETRSGEASVALQKLHYGEELDSNDGQASN